MENYYIHDASDLIRYGTEYSGFYYPKDLKGLDKDSIIYCVGAGEDISHDICIAKQLNSNIHIFDPTPRAIQHYKDINTAYNTNIVPKFNQKIGGGDPNYWNILFKNKIDISKLHYHSYGLYIKDDFVKFYKPLNTDYVSHSIVEGMTGEDFIHIPVKKIRTIMNELNHNYIDLLKIDIEGCECDVIDDMINEEIFPLYLSIDFDLGWNGNMICDKERCFETIKKLINHGYKIMHNYLSDYSFVYTKKINQSPNVIDRKVYL